MECVQTLPNIHTHITSNYGYLIIFDMLHFFVPEITQEVYELIKLKQPFEKSLFNVVITVDKNNTLRVWK